MRLHTERTLLAGDLNSAQEESLHVVLEEINWLNQIIEELPFLSPAEADAFAPSGKRPDPRGFLESFLQH